MGRGDPLGGNGLIAFGLWLSARAAEPCTFFVDGKPAERLDCAAGGAWMVRCPVPRDPGGKLRLHASIGDLVAEARVAPDSGATSVDVTLGGPGGRAGAFVVTRGGGGLLTGQAIGPNQWCPVVQPGVAPGSPRAEVPLDVRIAVHRQTGFAEEQLDGGVTNRVPIYDAGETLSSARISILRREVGTVPVTTGPVDLGPRDEPIRGQLSLAGKDGVWRSFSWTGSAIERSIDTGDVRILVLDFVGSDVGTASGADPVAWVEADLALWLAGDPSSLLGRAAWARSGFEPALGQPPAFASLPAKAGKPAWRVAANDRLEARIARVGERLRVVIAWRAAPWDAAVRKEVEAAAVRDL